jgi:hypothetical protein
MAGSLELFVLIRALVYSLNLFNPGKNFILPSPGVKQQYSVLPPVLIIFADKIVRIC